MQRLVFVAITVIFTIAAETAHLGYNYEPPAESLNLYDTKKSGYFYDAPLQGAPSALNTEYAGNSNTYEANDISLRYSTILQPVANQQHTVPASEHNEPNLFIPNALPAFVDSNALPADTSNEPVHIRPEVGTVYGSNGGYIY